MNRRTVCIVCLALCLPGLGIVGAPDAQAQFRDWNTGSGNWSDASNWNPNLLPGITEIARIGILPAATDAVVTLDQDTVVGGLQISNGMRLRTNGHNMQTVFDTYITGGNTHFSTLRIEDSIFGTRDLISSGSVNLSSGTLNVSRLLEMETDSIMLGHGVVNLSRDGGIAFNNNGTILTLNSPALVFNQLGTGLMDLDGTLGEGELICRGNVIPESISFHGTQLADAFSGKINLGTGCLLNMDFSQGWTADANAEINFWGNDLQAAPAILQGGDWALNGALNMRRDALRGNGTGRVESNTVMGGTASVRVESDNTLEFAGNVTIGGGQFLLLEDAQLDFLGNTLIQGGTFETYSELASEGSIHLNGLTAWDGSISVQGNIRQNGNAIVSGATTIDAGILDMDGNGNSNWTISAPLTINVNGLDSTISNSFDGTMSIAGGLSPQLTINLNQPTDHWTMAGDLNLANALNVGVNRIQGSRMRLTGNMSVDGMVGIGSDLTVGNSATISFADANTQLFTSGVTLIESNAEFLGEGQWINSTSGDLTLSDGVSMDNVYLQNYGALRIGSEAGIVDVIGFENLASGTLHIDIGGYAVGDDFDLLMVSGGQAILDGWLDVRLLDIGDGVFTPQLGDEFTILTSLDGVFGTFGNDPVSFADGRWYQWQVLYNSHDVTLRLDSIAGVPEPASGMILLASGLCLVGRRTRRRA